MSNIFGNSYYFINSFKC